MMEPAPYSASAVGSTAMSKLSAKVKRIKRKVVIGADKRDTGQLNAVRGLNARYVGRGG